MTTTELVKQLAARLDIPQSEAKKLVHGLFAELRTELLNGKNIILRDFGTFGVKDVPSRRGYIPGKNAVCEIPASRKPFFRAAKRLKEYISSWVPQ